MNAIVAMKKNTCFVYTGGHLTWPQTKQSLTYENQVNDFL